jgi:hypothetical protein
MGWGFVIGRTTPTISVNNFTLFMGLNILFCKLPPYTLIMNKKEFSSKDRKFFIDYIPEEILLQNGEEWTNHLYKYRDYHRYIHNRMVKIEECDNEIERLKKQKQKHLEAIEGVKVDGVVQSGGFMDKMKYHYEFVQHLDLNLRVTSWVESQTTISKSLKKMDGEMVKVDESFVFKNTNKGQPLKERITWRGKVEVQKKRKSFYLGMEPDILDELRRLDEFKDEDLTEWDWSDVKDEIKIILNQFSRYHIYQKSFPEFRKMEGVNLSKIVDWCLEMDKKKNDKGVSSRTDWS